MTNDDHIEDPSASGGDESCQGLARTIAKAGYGTRRQAEEMIRSGRVTVAGKRILDPGFGVTVGAEIRIDDREVVEVIRSYLAFHKPLNVATSATVFHRTKLISQYLPPDIQGLAPAGRLDTSTSGLLLVSNDSKWNALAASGHGFDKEFLLTVAGQVSEAQLGVIRAGMHIPKVGDIKPKSIDVLDRRDGTCHLNFVLQAGKIRQIRSLFTALRLDLQTIHRIRIGPVRLDSLGVSCWRPLDSLEIEKIRRGPSEPGKL